MFTCEIIKATLKQQKILIGMPKATKQSNNTMAIRTAINQLNAIEWREKSHFKGTKITTFTLNLQGTESSVLYTEPLEADTSQQLKGIQLKEHNANKARQIFLKNNS